jgi:Holliday junction resolvasome RuvABC endonuclease subunit
VSRVLAFDPGGERCGWAALRPGPIYIASGISAYPRPDNGVNAQFQVHRLKLIDHWLSKAYDLVTLYEPETVVTEIVPVGEGAARWQLALAATVATTIQCISKLEGIEVVQIGAGKVKKRIGGVKDASKVKVRNGVIELLPELVSRRREWIDTKVYDETDAIGLGLAQMGYEV